MTLKQIDNNKIKQKKLIDTLVLCLRLNLHSMYLFFIIIRIL